MGIQRSKPGWLLALIAITLVNLPIHADQAASADSAALTDEPIFEIDFTTIPSGTNFVSSRILLSGDVETAGSIVVGGDVEATGMICGSAGCVGDPAEPLFREALVTFDVPSGTPGGRALDAGVWVTRELNTVVYDPASLVVLSGDQILLDPGTYAVTSMQVFTAGLETIKSIQARLRNVTEDETVAISLASRLDAPQNTTQHADVTIPRTVFSVEFLAGFELQFFVETANASTNALGRPASSGETERYAYVHIERINP